MAFRRRTKSFRRGRFSRGGRRRSHRRVTRRSRGLRPLRVGVRM